MSKNKNTGRRSRSRTKTRTRTKRKENSSITVCSSVKPSRKTRTKTRKPKYLSLVHLEENKPAAQKSSKTKQQQKQQLNLFPLHPENSVEDRELDHVSLFFNTTEEDNAHAVSLSGLLGSQSSDNYKNETTTTTTATATATVTSEESPLSPSVTYDRTRLSLVRSAMKGKKERDESEEKWVVYSEVVDEKKEIEEVSSCCGGDGVDGGGGADDGGGGAWCNKKMMKKLALKLDYEEIMNAWSDKGPLYIGGGEPPQTVPDLHNASANVFVDGWGTNSVFEVPEMVSSFKIKEDFDGKEDWRRGHREESVLRYKEKRQNRLFSKRVRYEVRKLNAEKRPRLKGRFVKRD